MNPGSTATIWPYLIEGNQSRDWSVLRHSAAWARFGVYGQHAHGHGVGSPAREQPDPGLVHHSDQGSQYTDSGYQALLKDHGIQASMNSVGTWYDNAPMESFFGTLKSELVHHRVYRTRDEARADLFFYIEAFYNRRRLHSALDYRSPEAYEQLYHQQRELCLTPCPQN